MPPRARFLTGFPILGSNRGDRRVSDTDESSLSTAGGDGSGGSRRPTGAAACLRLRDGGSSRPAALTAAVRMLAPRPQRVGHENLCSVGPPGSKL